MEAPLLTTDLLADEFFEELWPPRPQHVVCQRAFSGEQALFERGDDHLFPDVFLLSGG
jgi:hypothetical protein